MGTRKIHNLESLYKLSYINLHQTMGTMQIPRIQTSNKIPLGLISFKDAMRYNHFNKFVHFYLEDGEFECVWRCPERYIKRLKFFSGILTPDFSLYVDMPIVVQAWNIYRSRVLGIILGKAGCKIIPTVSWSDSRSYPFAFDGIARNSTVSVSSVGIWRDRDFYRLFIDGLSAMISKISPSCIIFYGKVPDFDFGSIRIKVFQPNTFFWKSKSNGVYYRED